MSPGIASALVLLIWAGLCAADQRAIGSRQIHQPLVAAVVAGWILGAPDRGLLVGLWLQLVWPAPMPVGGALLPDTGSVAIAATAVAIAIPGGEGFLIAILFGLLIAWISIPWEQKLRADNGRREERVLARQGGGLGRAMLAGIAGPFMRGVACASLALVVATAARRWMEPLPPTHLSGSLSASLVGGAGTLGLSGLLVRVQTETGRTWLSWTVGGLVIGAAGRLLLEGLR